MGQDNNPLTSSSSLHSVHYCHFVTSVTQKLSAWVQSKSCAIATNCLQLLKLAFVFVFFFFSFLLPPFSHSAGGKKEKSLYSCVDFNVTLSENCLATCRCRLSLMLQPTVSMSAHSVNNMNHFLQIYNFQKAL